MRPMPQYCNFIKLKLFYILLQLCPYHLITCKCARWILLTSFHKDGFICRFIKLIWIFPHCPVSGKFCLKINMSRYCCYVSRMIKVVSQLQGKTIKSSNISPKLTSTKDLHNYEPTWHTLPIKALSLCCVTHKISTEKLFLLWIYALKSFSNLLLNCRKSSIHAFTKTPLLISTHVHSMWMVRRFSSLFFLFLAYYLLCYLLETRPHLFQFFEILCLSDLCS